MLNAGDPSMGPLISTKSVQDLIFSLCSSYILYKYQNINGSVMNYFKCEKSIKNLTVYYFARGKEEKKNL